MWAAGIDPTDADEVESSSVENWNDQSMTVLDSSGFDTRDDEPASSDRWLTDRHIETHAGHLVATYGDTTRPVWVIEPGGESYALGDMKVRDVPELQATTPANCLLIAASGPDDLVGVVMPAFRLIDAGDDGLTQSQRNALRFLSEACSATKLEVGHNWWNPWHWCRRWFGIGTS